MFSRGIQKLHQGHLEVTKVFSSCQIQKKLLKAVLTSKFKNLFTKKTKEKNSFKLVKKF